MSTYRWIETEVPKDLEIRQVYGFIFSSDGRTVLLEDVGKYNLPGGKPEKGESAFETLIREVNEEAQLSISTIEYLGYQLIKGDEEFAQVRFIAVIDQIHPPAADPSTGRMYSRLLVPPIQLNELLLWGKSGEGQIVIAIAAVSKLGVTWDGSPRSFI